MNWWVVGTLLYVFIVGACVGVVGTARFYWRREKQIRAALAAFHREQQADAHPWQEYNEHGNTCHHPGCRLAQDEHPEGGG